MHCTGGYMVYAHTTTKYVFNMQPGDTYWCTADCGWITGHTYLTYGPLLVGASQVVFEGVPTYPGPDRCWRVVDKYAVSWTGIWGDSRCEHAACLLRDLISSSSGSGGGV